LHQDFVELTSLTEALWDSKQALQDYDKFELVVYINKRVEGWRVNMELRWK
jgi:hypothetical protein